MCYFNYLYVFLYRKDDNNNYWVIGMTPKIPKLTLPNFREKDRTFVIRCQKCSKENYAPNVISGFCSWCGEDHNFYLSDSQ